MSGPCRASLSRDAPPAVYSAVSRGPGFSGAVHRRSHLQRGRERPGASRGAPRRARDARASIRDHLRRRRQQGWQLRPPEADRRRASGSRRHPVPPQLRADGRAGGRPRSVQGRRRHLHGRRPPERPGRDPAPAPDDGRGRLRRRQRLAEESAGRRAQPEAALPDGELADLEGQRRPASRLRLHAQGVPPRRAQERQAVRRDAPLHPGLRALGGRDRHRAAGQPPRAEVRQVEVRHQPDDQGSARPADPQVPEQLLDQADPAVRRPGRDVLPVRRPRDAVHALLAPVRGRPRPPEPGRADRDLPVPGRAPLHHPGPAGRAGHPNVLRVARQIDVRDTVDRRTRSERAPDR